MVGSLSFRIIDVRKNYPHEYHFHHPHISGRSMNVFTKQQLPRCSEAQHGHTHRVSCLS